MAEKEQRILITKVSSYCRAQRIACDPFDDEEGLFCDKNGQYVRVTEEQCAKCKNPVLSGISRSEAVERMAKAICLYDDDGGCNGVCNTECSSYTFCVPHAEAALDALLGEKK